jgi:hypothetical protein
MTKTHAEFLEELKNILQTRKLFFTAEASDPIMKGRVREIMELLEFIEKFQADIKDETADELLEELKEYCAVLAWSTGMDAFNNNRGNPVDASHIGSVIARKIRDIKIEQFQAEQAQQAQKEVIESANKLKVSAKKLKESLAEQNQANQK